MQTVEPPKPPNGAQIGRSFYMMTKINFAKTYQTPNQLVSLLKSRGLSIRDDAKAANYLTNIGYFRLSAYFYPLLETPKTDHCYKKGASFKQVMDMYRFDRKLRLLVFNEIEKIEVAVRSQIANMSSSMFNDLFWLTDEQYFADSNKFDTTLDVIDKEISNSKEDFILHFRNTYVEPYPPAWMIMEIIPLGTLTHIYINLRDHSLKKQIAQRFGLQPPVFKSWLIVLGGLRNLCCHHARMWNRELPIVPTEPKRMRHPWIQSNQTDRRRMYYRLCMIKYLLYTISPQNTFAEKLRNLLAKYPSIDIRAMGFPTNWETEQIWK